MERDLRFLACALSAALLFASCRDRAATAAPSEAPPRSVRVAVAQVRPMERIISASGTLAPKEESTLSAKIPGRLQQLSVDVGSVVRAGDVIARIEPRDYELRAQQASAALAQARAALGLPLEGEDDSVRLDEVSSVRGTKAVLDEAARNLERVSRLSEEGIASASDLSAVVAAHEVAVTRHEAALDDVRMRQATLAQRRAEYEIAVKQTTDTVVRAPFAGIVQARHAGLGEHVSVGAPVVTLVQADPFRLRIEVPERESMAVQVGQHVRVMVEGDSQPHTGRVTRLSPALHEASRMLLLEADIPAGGSLRPGLYASAEIVVDERDEALSVPADALVTFAGLEKVIVVEDGRAVEKSVATGRREAGFIEIVSGLAPGDTVVLDVAGVRTGEALTIVEQATQAVRDVAEPDRQ